LEPLLIIIPIMLDVPEQPLSELRSSIERQFARSTQLRLPHLTLDGAFDPRRGQYNSRVILQSLHAETAAGARVLGITSVDLFIPVLTYVFGEAELGGPAAVVSTHRLRPERYGLPEDPSLFHSRLEREAIHELGHTFGLLHCLSFSCVMHASTYVEEIDLKAPRLCSRCRAAAGV